MTGLPPALSVGALRCIKHGPTAGRPWSPSSARTTLRDLAAAAARAAASRRISFATPTQSMAHEGVPLTVVQRQLAHANLGITSTYLQGIDNSEIINTVFARPAPMLPASAGLH